MKVSIVEPIGGHGGMNYYDIGLGQGLLESGVGSTLYTSAETVEEYNGKFSIDKCFIDVFGKGNKLVRLVNYLRGVLYAARQISSNGEAFAHLHFFQYGFLEFFTCIVLRAYGLAIVATVHDVESFCNSKVSFFQSMILKLSNDFIVHNAFSKSELEKVFGHLGIYTAISIIPHGNYKPYVKSVCQKMARKSLGIPAGAEVLLFFGQIKDVKGLDILIDALARLRKTRPKVILLVAGKVWKTDFSKYRRRIIGHDLERNVIDHIRYIPAESVDSYYGSADVVVLPYKKIYQSGVLLMAMSYGKAVVVSDLPPMKEVVADGGNGFLFRSGSSIDLADVIDKALSSDLSLIGRAAFNTMGGDYSWGSIARKHVEVYKKYEK